ncbi:MAG: DUF1998 domain-containing protein [Phycisphaerae bacterium]|nr:DUF1998 domain-containing protein [Phycisphaerae bacterium]
MKRWRPLRRTQIITTFGIGAMVDFPGESLMLAGLDQWKYSSKDKIIDDIRLAKRMNVKYFVQPPVIIDGGESPNLPLLSIRFPLWYQCKTCSTLQKANWYDEKKGLIKCWKCDRSNTTPVRFVVACENGHISDFPWIEWVHKISSEDSDLDKADICDNPKLKLESYGPGLSGIRVMCVNCGKKTGISSAYSQNGVPGMKCTGERPWLGSEGKEVCAKKPKIVQRGASNVYFPEVISSILIPSGKKTSELHKIDLFCNDTEKVKKLKERANAEGIIDKLVIEISMEGAGIDVAFIEEFENRLYGIELDTDDKDISNDQIEVNYRLDEYNELLSCENIDKSKLITNEQNILEYDIFSDIFSNVVLVKKLSVTKVLRGFSRLTTDHESLCSLSLERKSWLPGVRTFGEGIFLKLNDEKVDKWSENPIIQKRIKYLLEREAILADSWHRDKRNLPDKFFLLHAISHILIRQLSFECGYGSSSLSERIYCNRNGGSPMSGILIYTAAGDTEGTMGGLVQQGKPQNLVRTLKKAINHSRWCSSDPVCIESKGQGSDSSNLAACHTCLLLPETCCEEGNRLLDRGLLIGTLVNPEAGFFND